MPDQPKASSTIQFGSIALNLSGFFSNDVVIHLTMNEQQYDAVRQIVGLFGHISLSRIIKLVPKGRSNQPLIKNSISIDIGFCFSFSKAVLVHSISHLFIYKILATWSLLTHTARLNNY